MCIISHHLEQISANDLQEIQFWPSQQNKAANLMETSRFRNLALRSASIQRVAALARIN